MKEKRNAKKSIVPFAQSTGHITRRFRVRSVAVYTHLHLYTRVFLCVRLSARITTLTVL